MKTAGRAKKVLIVDASRIMRVMIEEMLSESPYLDVVGLSDGAINGTSWIEELRPDVMLIDLSLPGIDVLEHLTMLQKYGGIRKVIIGASSELPEAVRQRLLDQGAIACFEKERIAKNPAWFRAEIINIADTQIAAPTAVAMKGRATELVPAGRPGAPRTCTLDERTRLEAITSLKIANDDPDARLDIITRHLTRVCDYPFAAITVIDASTQWTKSAVGVPRRPMARAQAMCAQTIGREGPLIVADTREHAIFRSLPQVLGSPHIRAYVGVPLIGRGGAHLGAVCLSDVKPRHTVQSEVTILTDMAQVVAELLVVKAVPAAA